MGLYLQIDGKMGCRSPHAIACALGEDREVAEHYVRQLGDALAGRTVELVELTHCPAAARDQELFYEHVEATDPQACAHTLQRRLDAALAELENVEWVDIGGDERRCPSCGAGEGQDGHARWCGLDRALRGRRGRH